jgi:hypothetical protein
MSNPLVRRLAAAATWPRLAALVLVSATAFPMALLRPIDGDEGFFLMAARLFAKGLAPYRDFFFIHAPAIPYVFGIWFRVFGPGWYAARVLAALLEVVIGLVLFEHLLRATGRWAWALVGVALYASAGLVLGWFSPVKSLGVSALFAFCGTALLARQRRGSLLAAGVLLGLSGSARLYLLVTVPCALLYLLRRRGWTRAFAREVVPLLIGAVIGSVPLIVALLGDHQAFFFGTIEYHALRDVHASGAIGDWKQKGEALLSILGFVDPDGGGSVQFFWLLVMAVLALVSRSTPRNSPFAPAWIALFVVSFLPTPTYQQYFAILVPFLIVEAVVLLASSPAVPFRPAVLGAAACAYLALGAADVHRFLVTGAGVPGVWLPDRVARWSIPHVLEVARAIDEQHLPVGASWWPGYFVSARTPIHIDLANDFGLLIGRKVAQARRRQFHIVSHTEVRNMLVRRDPPLFVEGNWAYRPNADKLESFGYRMVREVGPVKIWVAR